MAKSISASVGLKGVNRQPDVVTIQQMLNKVAPADGGPSVPLKVDGISGPKTQNAIQMFQLKHFGWKGADARVDPGGKTLAMLNVFDAASPQPTPPAPPAPPPALPTSTRFVIHRMASNTVFAPHDHELFFHLTDMVNGLIGIYWFQVSGRAMTTQQPPAKFTGASRQILTKGPHAVDKLACPSMYASRQISGKITSTMALILSTGGVQTDMPHHLIGPGGVISPGPGDIGTAIAGDLRFIKMG